MYASQVVGQLIAGGWKPKVAKIIGAAIHEIEADPGQAFEGTKNPPIVYCGVKASEFDEKDARKFVEGSFHKAVLDLVGGSQAAGMKTKSDDMDTKMANKPWWICAVVSTDASLESFAAVDPKLLPHKADEGQNLWLGARRAGIWSWGPLYTAMSGFPCAYVGQALDEDMSLYVVSINAEALLSNGITLKDAPLFFETASGEKALKTSKIFRLLESEVIYLPAGSVALPIVIRHDKADAESAKSKKRKKDDVPAKWALTLCMNFLCGHAIRDLSQEAQTALLKFNEEILDFKESKKTWKARIGLMKNVRDETW